MNKYWRKTGKGIYSFQAEGKQIATMQIVVNSMDTKATVKTQYDEYTIRRTGFWKNTVEIWGSSGQHLLKMYQDKWYVNYYNIEYNGETFKLIIRNNPLAEFALTDTNKQELIAYGLDVYDGKVKVRITSKDKLEAYLFDYLLWYLFVPIAAENMGETFLFHTLLSQ